jgi:UDP-2,4-diacetamido-2,4,6-trideoxy-beta-L-altropyranose hydrolase
MTEQSALFRCDATIETGSGHVMRCLTLAAHMRTQGWNCTFIAAPGTEDIVPPLARSGFAVIRPGTPAPRARVAVIDSYGLSAPDERSFRSIAEKIVVIDDLADRLHDCDILVDQTFGRAADAYDGLVPQECVILTGTAYTLLRPKFAAQREDTLRRRRDENGRMRRVLLSPGGTDARNILPLLLRAVDGCGLAIDVMTGSAIRHIDDLRRLIHDMRNNGMDIELHLDSLDAADLMSRADIAIGGGGTTSWERCCLGLPTLLLELADNQKIISQNLHDAGAVRNLGWYADVTSDAVRDALDCFMDDPALLYGMSQRAAAICDGHGTSRLYGRINA